MKERKEASMHLSLFTSENIMDWGVTSEVALDSNSILDDKPPKTPPADHGPSLISHTNSGRAIFLLPKTRFVTPILGGNPLSNEFSVEDCITIKDGKSVMLLSPTTIGRLDRLIHKDTVFITGKEGSDHSLLVLADEDCKDTNIKINEVARNYLCVNLGDLVTIRPFPGTIKYAFRIQFRPLGNTDWSVVNNMFEVYLKPYFRDACRPVSKDDLFLVNDDTHTVKFKIVDIDPPDYCIVLPDTLLCCENNPNEHDAEDVIILATEKEQNNAGTADWYESALNGLGRFLEAKPNDAIALRSRGYIYYRNSKHAKALIDLSNSLEIEPKDALTLSLRAYVYLELCECNNALLDLDKLLEIKPDDAIVLKRRGEVNYMLKKYNDALNDLNKSLEIKPNDATTLKWRGVVYFRLKLYDSALSDLNKSLEIKPNDSVTLRRRGNIHHMLGQYNDALDDYNKLLTIDPNDIMTLRSRADVNYILKKHDNALNDFNKLLAVDPNDTWTLSKRGSVYHRLKQYDNARTDFNGLLKINPKSASAFGARGYVNYMLKQYDNALKDFNEALEIEPNDTSILVKRGEVYYCLKRYPEALDDLNKSLEIISNAQALVLRGEVNFMLKKYSAALADLNRSLEIEPNNTWALNRRGFLYWRLKKYVKALEDFNRVLRMQRSGETSYEVDHWNKKANTKSNGFLKAKRKSITKVIGRIIH